MRRSREESFHEVLRALNAGVDQVPREQLPAALVQLAAVQTNLAARLAVSAMPTQGGAGVALDDRLLTVQQAADKLGVKAGWLYRHAARLPFTVRVSPRRVRFSERGINDYIALRKVS